MPVIYHCVHRCKVDTERPSLLGEMKAIEVYVNMCSRF